MDETLLALPGPNQRPGARERLAAIFAAESARQRARALRNAVLAVLGVLGLPLWLLAVWPARRGASMTTMATLVETIWAVTFAALLLALSWELVAGRRRARQIATLGPLPVLRSTRRGATAACAAPPEDQD